VQIPQTDRQIDPNVNLKPEAGKKMHSSECEDIDKSIDKSKFWAIRNVSNFVISQN
jgi:hypothetical protein